MIEITVALIAVFGAVLPFLLQKNKDLVRRAWHKVNPEEHANEVLETVDSLHL